MRKPIPAAMIVIAASLISACGQSRGESGGPTVSRNYQVGGFQQIEVAGPYDVQVRTGSGPSVSARGSEKLLERTVVEVKGDRLYIHPKEHHGFNFGWSSRGKASFVVTVPQLRGAPIAGSGGLKVDHVAGGAFEGTIAGSGGIELGQTDVQSLKLGIGGCGGVKAGSGKAKSAEYEIAGSGGIDASSLAAEQA